MNILKKIFIVVCVGAFSVSCNVVAKDKPTRDHLRALRKTPSQANIISVGSSSAPATGTASVLSTPGGVSRDGYYPDYADFAGGGSPSSPSALSGALRPVSEQPSSGLSEGYAPASKSQKSTGGSSAPSSGGAQPAQPTATKADKNKKGLPATSAASKARRSKSKLKPAKALDNSGPMAAAGASGTPVKPVEPAEPVEPREPSDIKPYKGEPIEWRPPYEGAMPGSRWLSGMPDSLHERIRLLPFDPQAAGATISVAEQVRRQAELERLNEQERRELEREARERELERERAEREAREREIERERLVREQAERDRIAEEQARARQQELENARRAQEAARTEQERQGAQEQVRRAQAERDTAQERAAQARRLRPAAPERSLINSAQELRQAQIAGGSVRPAAPQGLNGGSQPRSQMARITPRQPVPLRSAGGDISAVSDASGSVRPAARSFAPTTPGDIGQRVQAPRIEGPVIDASFVRVPEQNQLAIRPSQPGELAVMPPRELAVLPVGSAEVTTLDIRPSTQRSQPMSVRAWTNLLTPRISEAFLAEARNFRINLVYAGLSIPFAKALESPAAVRFIQRYIALPLAQAIEYGHQKGVFTAIDQARRSIGGQLGLIDANTEQQMALLNQKMQQEAQRATDIAYPAALNIYKMMTGEMPSASWAQGARNGLPAVLGYLAMNPQDTQRVFSAMVMPLSQYTSNRGGIIDLSRIGTAGLMAIDQGQSTQLAGQALPIVLGRSSASDSTAIAEAWVHALQMAPQASQPGFMQQAVSSVVSGVSKAVNRPPINMPRGGRIRRLNDVTGERDPFEFYDRYLGIDKDKAMADNDLKDLYSAIATQRGQLGEFATWYKKGSSGQAVGWLSKAVEPWSDAERKQNYTEFLQGYLRYCELIEQYEPLAQQKGLREPSQIVRQEIIAQIQQERDATLRLLQIEPPTENMALEPIGAVQKLSPQAQQQLEQEATYKILSDVVHPYQMLLVPSSSDIVISPAQGGESAGSVSQPVSVEPADTVVVGAPAETNVIDEAYRFVKNLKENDKDRYSASLADEDLRRHIKIITSIYHDPARRSDDDMRVVQEAYELLRDYDPTSMEAVD